MRSGAHRRDPNSRKAGKQMHALRQDQRDTAGLEAQPMLDGDVLL